MSAINTIAIAPSDPTVVYLADMLVSLKKDAETMKTSHA